MVKKTFSCSNPNTIHANVIATPPGAPKYCVILLSPNIVIMKLISAEPVAEIKIRFSIDITFSMIIYLTIRREPLIPTFSQ